MNITNQFQIPRHSKNEIFGRTALNEAMQYASLPYEELSEYGHLSYHELDEFINEFGSKDLLLASRRKNRLGNIQQCYIDDNGNLIKRHYIVKPSGALGPHSEIIRDAGGNVTHTVINGKESYHRYTFGNPKAVRADRLFLEGRAGQLQKFAIKLERPGLRRIAGFIFNLANKVR